LVLQQLQATQHVQRSRVVGCLLQCGVQIALCFLRLARIEGGAPGTDQAFQALFRIQAGQIGIVEDALETDQRPHAVALLGQRDGVGEALRQGIFRRCGHRRRGECWHAGHRQQQGQGEAMVRAVHGASLRGVCSD